jgi:hypothetical protein
MENKHTPGPWTIEQWQRGSKGLKLAILAPPDASGDNDYQVAVVSRVYNPLFNETSFPDDANARLIAAAPDMYEALKECEVFISGLKLDNTVDLPSCLERINAAIARAEGKE